MIRQGKNPRDDHVARYRFALTIASATRILDAGCGIGYGAAMMITAGRNVSAFDNDRPTVDDAWRTFGVAAQCTDFATFDSPVTFDLVTMFEVIEHSRDAIGFLSRVKARRLVASVPNQLVVPYDPVKSNPQHYRHFTPMEFCMTLESCGWHVVWQGGQVGKHGADAAVTERTAGKRTLVYIAERTMLIRLTPTPTIPILRSSAKETDR